MSAFTDWLRATGLSGYSISQGYGANPGRFGYGPAGHGGVDVAAPVGTPIKVPAGVAKIVAGQQRDENGKLAGWGNWLKVFFSDGSSTQFSHLSEFVGIKPGQTISNPLPGIWAKSGNTGNSTGPHIDIERRTPAGQRVNPAAASYGAGGWVPPTPAQIAEAAAKGLPMAPYITADGTPPAPGLSAVSEQALAAAQAAESGGSVWQQAGINAAGIVAAVALFFGGIYLLGRSF